MKQKVVIRVHMTCEKCRSKAMKIAAEYGVDKIAVEGEEKDKLVVVGDEVDSATLTKKLRKKLCHANIVSVQEEKVEKPANPKLKPADPKLKPADPKPADPKPDVHMQQCFPCPPHYVVIPAVECVDYCQTSPPFCSIL